MWPHRIAAERARTHRSAFGCGADARTLTDAVLNGIDLTHEIGAGHQGVGSIVLEQSQTGAVGARNGMGGEVGDVAQHVLEPSLTVSDSQLGQVGQAAGEVRVFGINVSLGVVDGRRSSLAHASPDDAQLTAVRSARPRSSAPGGWWTALGAEVLLITLRITAETARSGRA